MISNKLNAIEGIDPETDMLRKLGNRIKTPRLNVGHQNYERFAATHGIGRIQLRRVELGGNVKFNNLLKIIKALGGDAGGIFKRRI